MALAALILSILATIVAVAGFYYVRQQAVASVGSVAIERERLVEERARRHQERLPRLKFEVNSTRTYIGAVPILITNLSEIDLEPLAVTAVLSEVNRTPIDGMLDTRSSTATASVSTDTSLPAGAQTQVWAHLNSAPLREAPPVAVFRVTMRTSAGESWTAQYRLPLPIVLD